MKKILKDNENRISFIVFVITMLVAISPLISKYCINGHDLEYHLLRIESLKEGILIGKPFLKVNTLFFGGAGYASSMFYSDLFIYIPAILRVLGFSIGKSYHIFVALMFVLCYLSTFYSTYKMTGSKYTGTIAAVLLTLCEYHMDDMLVRAACGEYMAFVFVPLVVYGVYNVVVEEMDKPWIFGLGFAGLILSHPATLVLNVIFTVVVFLVYIKSIIKNPKVIIKLVVTTIVVLMVCAYQWIPMLEQVASANFYVSENIVDMLDAALPFYNLFSGDFPSMGYLLPVLAILRIFISGKDNKLIGYADTMIVMGFAFAIGASNIVPWDRLARFCGFIQFPWRLFTISSVLFAMADAVIIHEFIKSQEIKRSELWVFVVLALSIAIALPHYSVNATGYYDYGNDYYDYKPFTMSVIGGEWLPVSVTDRDNLLAYSEYMGAPDGSSIDFTRQKAVIEANIDNSYEYVDVPFIYYKGYKAKLYNEAGEMELGVTGDGSNGMCRVYLNGNTGMLKVYYGGTTLIRISSFVSIISILVIIGAAIYLKKGSKKIISSSQAIGALVLFISASLMLTGCSAQDVKNAADALEELNESLNNSESINTKDEAIEEEIVEEEEEEAVNPISYIVSSRGYDTNGQQYAIMKDASSEDIVYSVVSIDKAKKDGADVFIKSNLYGNIADSYIKDLEELYSKKSPDSSFNEITDELDKSVMLEADMLLFLEYFNEQKGAKEVEELANKLALLIYSASGMDENDIVLEYNCAAILSKASYILDNIEEKKDLRDLAIKLWDKAEDNNIDDDKIDANRAWAAAELFRATGNKTYRTVVEAISATTKLDGFTYNNPGYYAVFSYLSSKEHTDYKTSGSMMADFFNDANSMIKNSKEVLIEESLKEAKDDALSDDFINDVIQDCKLAIMANYISISVEYTRFAEDRILFLCGVNPMGIDYLDKDYFDNYEPILYALGGIRD